MVKIERLFSLYKVIVKSDVKGDCYTIVVTFNNGLKFSATHAVDKHLIINASVAGKSVTQYLNEHYYQEAYRKRKSHEAKELLKTLNHYNSKLLSRYLNR